ncbi:uridine diphosphate glucose pyrophosphatase NUDT22-like [Brachionichthys hirsutus]|uniref:uridine diphosphate glucose pyrophosphatase NUDT22-like n=1 Tax=Brachionichthys hirsutus TaxID=412623 RepID=UPI003604FA49
MDSDVSVLLHCAAWRGLLESQVQAELSESFNRRTDPSLERHIGEVWTERVSKQPWLFNGCKFRLHSFCLLATSTPSSSRSPKHPHGTRSLPEVEEHEPRLTLRLGLTCYRDFLGTNWSNQAWQLRRLGEAEFGDPLALLAQPLGVGAILRTDDSQVVFIRRSQRVAEAGGLLDIPGGHPEPKLVCERLGRAVREEQITVDMMQQRPVVSELFASVCSEIRDEVNIPLSALREPVLMGVALNHTSAGRPSAEFYVSCSLTSDDVRRLYWKGGAEAHESTDIVFLSRREVLQLSRSSPLWLEMCPSAKGAVLLYQTVKPDEEEHSKCRDNQLIVSDDGSKL